MWGTLLGGIAYSNLVFFPVLLSALPDSAMVVTGPYGLHEEAFWMAIHPAMIVSLIAALILNWPSRSRRLLIGTSVATYAVLLLVSLLYFIPELIAFSGSQESAASPSEWLARAERWKTLSWLRGAAAYVPLLLAISRPAHVPAGARATPVPESTDDE